MIENSTGEVGRAAIDAYLDSVEQAMLAVNAPRRDRMQVLEDIEAQIGDMLAQQPAPLTEEAVRAVIGKLEPPSHFGQIYGNGKPSRAASGKPNLSALAWHWPSPWPAMLGMPWTRIAVASLTVMVVSALLVAFYLLVNRRPAEPELLMFSLFAAFGLTSCSLPLAYWQIRSQPGRSSERDLFVKCATAHTVIVLLFIIFILTIATDGAALVPVAILGLIYIFYAFVQWWRQWLTAALAKEPNELRNEGESCRAPAPPVGSAARAV
jgi:hypothetical protein